MKQKLQAILDDDRGVSPVIGVILMVAITVILAAVIGTFVLGLGDSLQTTPQSTISITDATNSFDSSGTAGQDMFVISHNGGDALEFANVQIIVREAGGSSMGTFQSSNSYAVTSENLVASHNGGTVSGEFAVGDTVTISESTGNNATSFTSGNDYTVQIIHVPSDSIIGESTVTLR